MKSRIRILSLIAILIVSFSLPGATAETRSPILDSDGKLYEIEPPLSLPPWELDDFYPVEYDERLENMVYSNLELYNNEDNIISGHGGLTIYYEAVQDDGLSLQETSLLMSPYGRMFVNRWGEGAYEIYILSSGGVITGPHGYEYDENLAGTMDIDYLWDNYMFPWAGGYTYIFGVRDGEDDVRYFYMLNSDMVLYEYVVCMEYYILEIRRYQIDESGENCVYDGRVWFTAGEVDIPEEVEALFSDHLAAQGEE